MKLWYSSESGLHDETSSLKTGPLEQTVESIAVGTIEERSAQGVVELVVRDLRASARFYEVLGFEIERRHTDTFLVLKRGDLRIFLPEDPETPAVSRGVNLRIIVRDVDDVWEVALKAGLRIAIPIGDRAYGLRDFTVQDPSGFELRFATPIDC